MKINIQFQLKDVKAASSPVMLLCYHKYFNGGRFRYYLPAIDSRLWDCKRKKAKDRAINERLQLLKSEVDLILTRQLFADRRVITNDWLKEQIDTLLGKEPKGTPPPKEDFFSVWERLILQTKTTRDGKIEALTPATIRSKKNTMNRIKDFAKASGWKPSFKNMDKQFYNDFTDFLKKRGVGVISKFYKDIKSALREAEEYQYEVNQTYKSKSLRVIKEKPKDAVYLSETELQTLLNLELPEHLANVRDTFAMACYCGLRHSDWKQIHPDNITKIDGRDYISLKPQKTKAPVRIPVHPVIAQLLSKHSGQPPRVLSNQKTNEYLKTIMSKAELGKVILGGLITDKNLHITSHTARRSFATNAYLSKMPSHLIMAITGHKSEKDFLKYLKVGENELTKIAAESTFFEAPKMKVA